MFSQKNLNTDLIENMYHMFYNCNSWKRLDLTNIVSTTALTTPRLLP